MSLKLKSICVGAVLFMLAGCGGGGDTNTGDTNTLVNVATYEFTPTFLERENILLDQNKIILAGGQVGDAADAQHDGHPAFSDQVYVIDLATSIQSSFTVNAESGHAFGDTVANGIGNQAIIRRISDEEYLIYGGFQYAKNTFILDLNQASIQTYPIDITFTDDTGNTTPFYSNNQASAIFENGDFAFFGFNNGLYGMSAVVLFDNNNSLSYQYISAELTMGRSNVDAYTLLDGKVLLVGGWDGTASVLPDSATRRVEIYDPSLGTVERVADYPEPKHNGQHRSSDIVADNEVCVDNYQYNVTENTWSVGCTINDGSNDSNNYILPVGYSGNFLGRASNGQLIFVEQNYSYNSLEFSDECSCYPYSDGTKIHVFSVE